jgi:hypothetical protein
MTFCLVLLIAALLAGCSGGEAGPADGGATAGDAAIDAGGGGPADTGVPDAGVPLEGCDTSDPGKICVGAAKVVLTPDTFETVKPELLEDHDDCIDGNPTCGTIDDGKIKTAYKGKWAKNFWNDANGDGRFDGYWIAGYGASRPMQTVHDDIWARAVVLRSAGRTVAIVSIDTVGIFYSDVIKVRRKVTVRHPELGVETVILSSSHSHHALDTMGMWGMTDPYSGIYAGTPDTYLGKVNDEFVDGILEKTAGVIVDAARAMKPATLKAATVRAGIDNLCSDLRDPFILDDHLSVLDAVADDGERIATLVNFSCHPETVSGDSNALSSDYPHFLREALENGLPAAGSRPAVAGLGGTAIFLQGALGGMASPLRMPVTDRAGIDRTREDFERARAIGEALAEKAFDALGGAAAVADTTVAHAEKTFRVPVANKYFWLLFDLGVLRPRQMYKIDPSKETYLDNVEIETAAAMLRIGPVTFATVPGEAFPELAVGGYTAPYDYSYGHPILDPANQYPPDLSKAPAGPYLRDIMPGKVKFLLGLGLDELGYLVPGYDFRVSDTNPYIDRPPGDHYEETNGIGPAIVGLVFSAWRDLAEKL